MAEEESCHLLLFMWHSFHFCGETSTFHLGGKMFESFAENKQYYAGRSAHDESLRTTFYKVESATHDIPNIVMDPSSVDYDNIHDSFPFKLHMMLSETEEQGLGHVVAWQPHGRCFVVRNRTEFVKTIMPSFFRMSKYESFQRQLNLYGFNRIPAGRDKGGYYHKSFVKARRDLCFEIQRHKVKGTLVRKPAARETEPNFYGPPIRASNSAARKVSLQKDAPSHQDSMGFGFTYMHDEITDQYEASGQSLVSVMAPNASSVNSTMMQSFMNLSPCMTTSAPNTYAGEQACRHVGGEFSLPSFPFLGNQSDEPPQTPPACTSISAGLQQHSSQTPAQQQSNQQSILDDLDKSFENLLSALRTMDSIYLLSLGGQGL